MNKSAQFWKKPLKTENNNSIIIIIIILLIHTNIWKAFFIIFLSKTYGNINEEATIEMTFTWTVHFRERERAGVVVPSWILHVH